MLQLQLKRLRELKSGYKELHESLQKHVSALKGEDQQQTLKKRCKAGSAELDTENQDHPAQPAPTDRLTTTTAAPPALGGNTDSEQLRSEDTRKELLAAFDRHTGALASTAELERNAASAVALDLDRWDACAVLTGRKARYYVHQTTVSVGRSSILKGQVCSPV